MMLKTLAAVSAASSLENKNTEKGSGENQL